MTNEYLFLYRYGESCWSTIEDSAETVEQFIRDTISDETIANAEWKVIEKSQSLHKDDFIHDGTLDDIFEEQLG